MTEIVLFHSVVGVRPGLLELADRWRSDGHVVHVPDLFDGKVFDEYAPAFDYAREIGELPTLLERADAALAGMSTDVVYAGFSMGTALLSHAVVTRPGARGALVCSGATPVGVVEGDVWPSAVPVEAHEAELDPYRQPEAAAQFAEDVSSSGAAYTYHSYPGIQGHLFPDPSMPGEYDADAAALMYQRASSFLARLG